MFDRQLVDDLEIMVFQPCPDVRMVWMATGRDGWPILPDRPRTRDIERMIDQRLDAFEEPHRVREFGVAVERRFVCPARMDVEQQPIARGWNDRPRRHGSPALRGSAR